MAKDYKAEAARRAKIHAAKEAKAAKRAAQKARGRAGRGSDPNRVSKADMRRALDSQEW